MYQSITRGMLIVGLLTLIACAGQRPSDLGPRDNRLAGCPDSPNCVSSFETRDSHYVDALRGDLTMVKAAITRMPRVEIIQEDGPYLYAEFTSRLMGYVDDVEFLADAQAGIVHVRSASRLGYSDLGVNRERIDMIRTLMASD